VSVLCDSLRLNYSLAISVHSHSFRLYFSLSFASVPPPPRQAFSVSFPLNSSFPPFFPPVWCAMELPRGPSTGPQTSERRHGWAAGRDGQPEAAGMGRMQPCPRRSLLLRFPSPQAWEDPWTGSFPQRPARCCGVCQ